MVVRGYGVNHPDTNQVIAEFNLCKTFGWKPIKEIPKENIGNYSLDNFPEYVLKQIKLVTKSDNELYKFGKELFNERYNVD